MLILGFQKLTLLDFPQHTACTVFTGGCNLRCPFCHNALLVTEADECEPIPEDEIFSYLEKRKKLLDGVAVTGGEPLIQPGIEDFLRRVKDMGYAVKLDTNGFFPERLKNIAREGLEEYVAVDIKNSPEKYPETCGREKLDLVPLRETVEFLKTDIVPYEFRTTVVKELHTLEDIKKIGAWIEGAKHWYLQAFVDSGNLIGTGFSACSKAEMHTFREEAARFVKNAGIRGID